MPNPRWLDEVTQADAVTLAEAPHRADPGYLMPAEKHRHHLLLLVGPLVKALRQVRDRMDCTCPIGAVTKNHGTVDAHYGDCGFEVIDKVLALADAPTPPGEE